jgi:hypothetical protein
LGLSLLDGVTVLVPTRFLNAAWELETMGNLIDRVPVPLLGMALVFYGGVQMRQPWEHYSLRVLSWLSLVAGTVLVMMIPLMVGDTMRVREQTTVQIRSQVDQQLSQAHQLEQLVSAAKPEEIESILRRQSQVTEGKSVDEMKTHLLAAVSHAKQSLRVQADATLTGQQTNLAKNTIKYSLSAVVAGGFFIYCWRVTKWARVAKLT